MKKKLINPYVKSLIKENLMFIITLIILIFLIIFVHIYNSQKINENDSKISELEKQIKEYENKSRILNSPFAQSNKQELESYVQILNLLIPNTEDFFSIIYSLETLSKKTGFNISSYTVNLKKSTKDKISISILGTGSQEYFTNFLKSYNFDGGRFITIDSIDLTPQFSGLIKLDVSFYSKNSGDIKNAPLVLNQKAFDELAKIKNKINFQIMESQETEIDTNYPKKSNPFSDKAQTTLSPSPIEATESAQPTEEPIKDQESVSD